MGPTDKTGKGEAGDAPMQALAGALAAGSRVLRWVIAAAVLAYLVRSSVFVVPQHEVAFVLRFGRIVGRGEERLRRPGLHAAFPYPIDQVVRIPTARVRSVQSDSFWAAEPAEPEADRPASARLRPGLDGYVLTGDANILHASWALRYTVEDPELALFGVNRLDRLLRNELDHAVVRVCASLPVDGALRNRIEEFRLGVESLVRQRTAPLGIRVERVDLLAAQPPAQVRPAFDAVVMAEQQRSQTISAARTYAARRENEAAARKTTLLATAEIQRNALLSAIRADADYFEKVLAKYAAEPRIIAQTLLHDTLRRVLSGVAEKYVVSETSDGRQEVRLLVGPERPAPGRAAGETGKGRTAAGAD